MPPVRQAFCGKFFIFVGGRGKPSAGARGFSPPPEPPSPFPARFILVSVTARRCRGFPLFAVPRRRGKGVRAGGKKPFRAPPLLFFAPTLPTTKRPCAGIRHRGASRNRILSLSINTGKTDGTLPRTTGGRLFQERRLRSRSHPFSQVKRAGEGWGFGGGGPLSR